ncbi:hypothetical protein NQZ68_028867 [Dissostichus eleginoides]|nr:hypothetical protein NQZ68_028867 [Dissostichus eleginoides]
MQNVGKGKKKILLQISDIILPSAHIQTKQGYVSVGGGRKRWQNSKSLKVCPIPALISAAQFLWFAAGRVSVSFCL